MPAVSPADSGSPHSAHEKQFTWNIKSLARITRSDDPMPAPHRAHRRIENILQGNTKSNSPFTVMSNVLGSCNRKRNRRSENVTCHRAEPSSRLAFPSTHFPHVQLFSSFILVFCLFAHNYDSPKKNDEKKANANGQK